MKYILKFLTFWVMLILIVALHLGVLYVFTSPFDNIHIIFVYLILWLYTKPTGLVVWFAFFAFFILDLLSLSPFGVSLLAGTLSMLVVYWLYRFVFSNRSIISITFLTMLLVCLFRMIFISVYAVILFFQQAEIPFMQMIITTFLEIVLTTFVVGVVYLITLFRKDRIHKKSNRYGIIT